MKTYNNNTISSIAARIALASTALALMAAAFLVSGCELADNTASKASIAFGGKPEESRTPVCWCVGVGRSKNAAGQADRYRDFFDRLIKQLKPGDRVIVDSIHSNQMAMGEKAVDVTMPAAPGLDDQEWRTRKANEEALARLNDGFNAILESEVQAQSDIIGFNTFCGYEFYNSPDSVKKMLIMTDGYQKNELYDFTPGITAGMADRVITTERDAGRLPSLAGVQVWFVGVSSGEYASRGEEERRRLREIWSRYYEATGADIETYGPEPLGF